MGFIQKAQAAVNESARAEMQRRRTMPLGNDIGYKHKGYGKFGKVSRRTWAVCWTSGLYALLPITPVFLETKLPVNPILGKSEGIRRAGAIRNSGPQDAVSAAKPLDNTPHLFAVKGAKRDGSNGSHRRCDLQQMGANSFVVRCLEDNYHVVGTYRPVGLLQLHPVLLGNLGTTVGSGDGIRYVFDALVGVVHQTDISGHRACAPFLPFTPKHQWCLVMKPGAPLLRARTYLYSRKSEKSSSRKVGFR